MTCAACTSSVERALAAVPGVMKVRISLALGEAEVECTASAQENDLLQAVEDAGFGAQVTNGSATHCISIDIQGISKGSSADDIEKALKGRPGVMEVNMSDASRVEVEYNPDATGPRDLVRAVQELGFGARLVESGGDAERVDAQCREREYWWTLFSTSLLFSVPVFLMAMLVPRMPGGSVVKTEVLGLPFDVLFKWALTTPVQFVIGWRFQSGAWRALRRGTANMDVLVALGTDASYLYSIISVLHHRFLDHTRNEYTPTDFFETSAMLITFILMGKYLESAAKGKTSEAIASLLRLMPDGAVLVALGKNGDVVMEDDIPCNLVQKGDYLKIYPGARVPADGVVVEGVSHMNESMITGESREVVKKQGDNVIGGTVNTGGALLIKATRVGSDTSLAQIVRLVERAQLSKAPIQAMADRVSSIFVPIIVCLACLTWLAWYISGKAGMFPAEWVPQGHDFFLFALLFAIAVLVIACPCALGLATPTAVMVGTGLGAQMGILIKGGEALEKAHNVDSIIFDKTGTLTLGKPYVVTHQLFDPDVSSEELFALATAAEASSEHPLSRAIMKHGFRLLAGPNDRCPSPSPDTQRSCGKKREKMEVGWVRPSRNVDNRPGKGVVCQTDGRKGAEARVAVGSARLMKEEGMSISEEVSGALQAYCFDLSGSLGDCLSTACRLRIHCAAFFFEERTLERMLCMQGCCVTL
ncbi:unnamed protein product [Ostreobium quekettii]|uniref:P-type Cu(+) transporter n=1 Tax=Ostreobium quekettii TaxID=121088 RepID=A0A8S1JEX9_9CHLO|nr:unnamed protein product [Ostreobium quekettii]